MNAAAMQEPQGQALVPLPAGPLGLPPADDPQAPVWRVLEAVTDPEIPVVNLREMGILRRVRLEAGSLVVDITPTYSGCPAMRQMALDIEQALAPRYGRVKVQTHLSPAWSTDWITPEAREKLRAWGIAPPVGSAPNVGGGACGAATGVAASSAQALQFALHAPAADPVPCPRCGSLDTMAVAQFGSTACKALYRCLSCHEPFDYFKPY